LIDWQNLYAPRGRWCIGRREAQSHEPVNKGKALPVAGKWQFIYILRGNVVA
jgi:hypothetical protein